MIWELDKGAEWWVVLYASWLGRGLIKDNDASGIFAKYRGLFALDNSFGYSLWAKNPRDEAKMSPEGAGAKWTFEHKHLNLPFCARLARWIL